MTRSTTASSDETTTSTRRRRLSAANRAAARKLMHPSCAVDQPPSNIRGPPRPVYQQRLSSPPAAGSAVGKVAEYRKPYFGCRRCYGPKPLRYRETCQAVAGAGRFAGGQPDLDRRIRGSGAGRVVHVLLHRWVERGGSGDNPAADVDGCRRQGLYSQRVRVAQPAA